MIHINILTLYVNDILMNIYYFWADAGPLLRALTQFSHLTADTIINGSATAHTAPVDLGDRKTEIV